MTKCSKPDCDRVVTDYFKGVGYCLGHYLEIYLSTILHGLERKPGPGPTEFKESRDA